MSRLCHPRVVKLLLHATALGGPRSSIPSRRCPVPALASEGGSVAARGRRVLAAVRGLRLRRTILGCALLVAVRCEAEKCAVRAWRAGAAQFAAFVLHDAGVFALGVANRVLVIAGAGGGVACFLFIFGLVLRASGRAVLSHLPMSGLSDISVDLSMSVLVVASLEERTRPERLLVSDLGFLEFTLSKAPTTTRSQPLWRRFQFRSCAGAGASERETAVTCKHTLSTRAKPGGDARCPLADQAYCPS